MIVWYSQWKKLGRANEAISFRDNKVNVELQCLSDSSVFCHDITHVKHFKDLELFCSVGAHKVFVETILDTETVFKVSKQYNKWRY